MENRECKTNKNMRHIFSDFMGKIAQFVELVTQGSKLILDFQHGLNFVRRPPFEKTALVDQISKLNQSKKLSCYLEAGGLQVHDATENVGRLHLCHLGLMDHLIEGKIIVDELEVCVRNATSEVNATSENLYSDDKDQKYDEVDYAAAMAILCSMVKQDYRMQEHIVLSLGLSEIVFRGTRELLPDVVSKTLHRRRFHVFCLETCSINVDQICASVSN